jgi:hypothetical protein
LEYHRTVALSDLQTIERLGVDEDQKERLRDTVNQLASPMHSGHMTARWAIDITDLDSLI